MEQMLPLSGYKVVELATVVAAPTAGRVMADFGAEVIKVEMPGSGDLLRAMGDAHQLPVEPDNNPLFDLFNAGKKVVAINLKSPDGMEALLRLLEDADVFLTNTRMRSLVKMGLGYETLKERYPRLIYAHFSGYGNRGPESERPGFDTTAFWLRSGAAVDWSLPGAFPVRPTFGFGDIATSGYFLDGILMALLARERTGKGTLIETSLFGSGLWHNAPYVVNCQPQYGRQLPADRYDPWDPLSDFYACSDGEWLAPVKKVYAKDRFVFARLFDFPEMAEEGDFRSLDAMRRAGKISECSRRIAEAMEKKSSKEWAEMFSENDIPCERGAHFCELYRDEQAWANEFLENVAYPGDVTTAVPVPPIRFSAYARRSFQQQTRVGADTDEILGGLGYSEEQLRTMREEGAIL